MELTFLTPYLKGLENWCGSRVFSYWVKINSSNTLLGMLSEVMGLNLLGSNLDLFGFGTRIIIPFLRGLGKLLN